MSRRARLSLTLTVLAAVVLAANALMSGGPVTTTEITVVSGDTLWSIAQRAAPDAEVWSVIDDISALNGLTGVDVVPGQVLVVPVG
jgi:LysM repeat protein